MLAYADYSDVVICHLMHWKKKIFFDSNILEEDRTFLFQKMLTIGY